MNAAKLGKLRSQLEDQSIGMGARFFGVADVTVAREFIVEQGGEFLAAYPRALSVGIALNDGIVDQLPRHKKIAVARTYDYLYDTVNQSLNRIALHLSATLSRNNFQALQIPATDRVDNDNIRGLFSQKLAANLAGLGWIGPSCLLITPELGPRVRWVTVLTDAPLEAGSPIASQCEDCRQCVDACPPKAFTGRPFEPSEHRDFRFDVHRCIKYRLNLSQKTTGVQVCGMCVYVCPFGRSEAQ